MSKNNTGIEMTASPKLRRTRITADQIADKVEYLINEADPSIKTRRGASDEIEIRLGRAKWLVKIYKPRRKKAEF